VKKLFILLMFGFVGVCAMYFNMACTSKSPSAPGFQTPLQTIVAINPPWTNTPTNTLTFTPTITPTPTNTGTPTPYATNTPWIGFKNPQGIAFYNSANNGGLFVADTGNNQVKKLTVNGIHETNWGAKGIVEVNSPQGVAVDGNGNLYVVGGISGVNKYNASGSVTTFTTVTFTHPQGVAVDSNFNVYVSDTTNIVELNSGGVSIANLPITAVGGVTLTAPYGIAVDRNNNVAVAASDNNIHYYSSMSGTVITTIPGYPITPPAFNFNYSAGVSMGGIAFDSGNNLYVADTGYHQAEEFANYGLNFSPIDIFNGNGTLNSPTGVAVDGNGNIYVTDSINDNVVKFIP
jgi:NHL repeat